MRGACQLFYRRKKKNRAWKFLRVDILILFNFYFVEHETGERKKVDFFC